MNRSKTTRRVGMAAAALLLGATIGFTGPSAGASISRSEFTTATSAGHLALQVSGSSLRVVQYNTATPPAVIDTETFSVSNKCEVTGGGRLLAISSSTGRVGSVNNGLGTKTKNNCATDEGRVGIAPESLTVRLGSKFGSSISIDRVELDIEGKFGASLGWTTNGTTASSGTTPLSTSSDNGPDSGTGDNNRVNLGQAGVLADNFTQITLRAAADRGEIALDGGGDSGFTPALANSKGTYDSLFLLTTATTYEYTVDCGAQVVADNTDNTSDGAGVDSTVAEVLFVRLPNKGQTTCEPIGVNVQASNGGAGGNDDDVLVDNSPTGATGNPQDVRARVRLIWIVETAGKTPAQVEAELAREINYTPANPAGLHPVQWCTTVPGPVAAQPLSALDAVGHPNGEPWCLLSDERVLSGTTIIQTQIYSGNGDPQWR